MHHSVHALLNGAQ